MVNPTTTKIVVGKIQDGASSELSTVTAELFHSIYDTPVQLANTHLGAASVEVVSAVTYTATDDGDPDGTTIVNTAHTEADDFWNGYTVKMLTGTCVGQTCVVSDFDKTTATLTLTGDGFTAQIDEDDTYTFVFVEDTDYTINYTVGAVTVVDGEDMFDDTDYLISYDYQIQNLPFKIQQVLDSAASTAYVLTAKSGERGIAIIIYTPT